MSARSSRAHVTLSWGLLDQIVSSGSNFLFMIIAAKALHPTEFGAIAFVFELYLLSVFVARGIASDPLTSRYSGFTTDALHQPTRTAATATVVLAAIVGAGIAVVAPFIHSPLRGVLFVTAIALPALTLQDYVRNALIVAGRVRSTFVNDTFWAIVQLPAFGLAIWLHPSAVTVFAAWAITGGVAALVGLFQLKVGLAPLRTVAQWLRDTRDLWPYYVADNLLYQATSLLVVGIISATSGLVGLAGFRVAMTVYAPLATIGRGIISVAVAMLARRRDDPPAVRRLALLISWVMTPTAIVWGFIMLLVPEWLGEAVFGLSWREAEPLVFWASFVCAAGLFGSGAVAGMRALSAGRHVVIARVAASTCAGAFAIVGGLMDGVQGMLIALSWGFPLQSAIWWLMLHDAARRSVAVDQPNAST